MAPSELVEVAEPEVALAVAFVVLAREGFRAPHGWSCVHAARHVPLPLQPVWH